MSLAKVILKAGKESPVKALHPWVFSGAIERSEGKLDDGTPVEVYSSQKEFLGMGFYSPSSLAVKMLFGRERLPIDQLLFTSIERAVQLRRNLGLIDSDTTTGYRLVNGEGDFLPGLIIDRYGETAVVQLHSAGMFRYRTTIAESIITALSGKLRAVYFRIEESLAKSLKMERRGGFLRGDSEPGLILENGLAFHVDWIEGQKTGFFLDQRENRALVRDYARGREVLNAFSYTGGFSVYALAGGARHVVSIDASKDATILAARNVEANFPDASHESVTADCFEYLQTIDGKFDLVVLDPPAFAKHRDALQGALKGYRTVNLHALKGIRTGGLLFTFSCSQVVSRDQFTETVRSAASEAGRRVRILKVLSQAPCHPSSVCHPEGSYLKGLLLSVDE